MGVLSEHIDRFAPPDVTDAPPGHAAMLAEVRDRIDQGLAHVSTALADRALVGALSGGKLLRTSLSARLWRATQGVSLETWATCCAATELVHTATLLHDDVLDGGLLRRGRTALWLKVGPSAAVLTGDALLCHGINLVAEVDGGRWLGPLVRAITVTCMAEVEQDVRSATAAAGDEAMCLRIARGKTGPLFAFPAMVAGGPEGALTAALREVGHAVGTIYQLADDLLDVVGPPGAGGKTLGLDAQLGRPTLARLNERSVENEDGNGNGRRAGPAATCRSIRRLCDRIGTLLLPWPAALAAVGAFFRLDVQPALDAGGLGLDVSVPSPPPGRYERP